MVECEGNKSRSDGRHVDTCVTDGDHPLSIICPFPVSLTLMFSCSLPPLNAGPLDHLPDNAVNKKPAVQTGQRANTFVPEKRRDPVVR